MKILANLHIGDQGYIERLEGAPHMKRRLQDIGMVPGTQVFCAHQSPLGDPLAFLIKGTLIAIRREDARHIYLR